MTVKVTRFLVLALFLAMILVSGCFKILSVTQPSTAFPGEQITIMLEVRTDGTDVNPHYGILGLLLANDWTVVKIEYSGDFGPDEMSFLHPDSVDGDPGGKMNFWTDTLETRYPSGDDYQWVVYQANTPFASSIDTGYVDVVIALQTGSTGKMYNIGYFVTNAAMDFTDPGWYDVNLNNPIEIKGGTDAENPTDRPIPDEFRLYQNYPNPFNPTTTIRFDLPEAGLTRIEVYNLLGERVRILSDDHFSAGSHRIIFDARGLNTGIYYYQIQSGDFVDVRKFALIK